MKSALFRTWVATEDSHCCEHEWLLRIRIIANLVKEWLIKHLKSNKYMSNLPQLQVVSRDSETQLQVEIKYKKT